MTRAEFDEQKGELIMRKYPHFTREQLQQELTLQWKQLPKNKNGTLKTGTTLKTKLIKKRSKQEKPKPERKYNNSLNSESNNQNKNKQDFYDDMKDVFLTAATERSELVVETAQLPEQFAKRLEVEESSELNTVHELGMML